MQTNIKTVFFFLGLLVSFSTWAGSVNLKVFAPHSDDVAGISSRGFLVDLRAIFDGDLQSTGVSLELTGPGSMANTGPFPGDFSPGMDPSFPGLLVLLSTSKPGAGPGQNLANLFNIVSVTNQTEDETEIWATWIIGAKNLFGTEGEVVPSTLFVAIVDGDAPDVVVDMNNDGEFDKDDLEMMGYEVISNAKEVDFFVNGL